MNARSLRATDTTPDGLRGRPRNAAPPGSVSASAFKRPPVAWETRCVGRPACLVFRSDRGAARPGPHHAPDTGGTGAARASVECGQRLKCPSCETREPGEHPANQGPREPCPATNRNLPARFRSTKALVRPKGSRCGSLPTRFPSEVAVWTPASGGRFDSEGSETSRSGPRGCSGHLPRCGSTAVESRRCGAGVADRRSSPHEREVGVGASPGGSRVRAAQGDRAAARAWKRTPFLIRSG